MNRDVDCGIRKVLIDAVYIITLYNMSAPDIKSPPFFKHDGSSHQTLKKNFDLYIFA